MDSNPLWERAEKLSQIEGLNFWQALDRAQLEQNIDNWPVAWGNRILVVIYGDFLPPSEDVTFSELGITINHENKKGSKFQSAMCVLDLWITVKERSESEVMDAIRRLNIFLGSWSLSGGCSSCNWCCSLIHGLIGKGAGFAEIDFRSLEGVCNAFLNLPDIGDLRFKVSSALYWVRASRSATMNGKTYGNDSISIYFGYWNAFECLVDAVSIIKPSSLQESEKREEKQGKINAFIKERISEHETLTAKDIQECYNTIINTSFRGKATYVLTVCFSDPDPYIRDCFGMPNKEDNLYNIRNAIDHGVIDVNDPKEILRIERRFIQLYRIVRNMFDWIMSTAFRIE